MTLKHHTLRSSRGFPIESSDIHRIQAMNNRILEMDITEIFRDIFSTDLPEDVFHSFKHHCEFFHGALLVFPSSLEALCELLTDLGYILREPMPSMVVKHRICQRYGLDEALTDIWIVHGTLPQFAGLRRGIEVFVLPYHTHGITRTIIAGERDMEYENHFAFHIKKPDLIVLQGLKHILINYGQFLPDGGGINSYTNMYKDGETVLYFAKDVIDASGQKRLQRLEIHCCGHYQRMVSENCSQIKIHPASSD